MPLKNYHKAVSDTPDELDFHVEDSMHILERIHELLESKFDGKQKLLAEKLGKSEAEVSKMLSGVQNFTLRTLSKLKAAFGEPIIAVVTSHEQADFVQVKTAPGQGHARLCVNNNGKVGEELYSPSTKHSTQKESQSSNMDLV